MKTIDSTLLAKYQSAAPTIVGYVEIVRTDDTAFRWIALDRDLVISGNTYTAAPGVSFSSLVSSEGFAVDNAEVTVLDNGGPVQRADILAGIWDGATMEFGEVDFKAVTPVKNVLKSGTLGAFVAKRNSFTAEFRDLRQAIQANREMVLQPTCRNKLGIRSGSSHCPVDLDDYTVTGTIDSSASQLSVVDAARSEADDYFGEGTFTFTSGGNAGLTQKIKTYNSTTKTFVFWAGFIFPIAGTETYTATAGCRLRFVEDCIGKFDVGVDFGGEPNKLNPDTLLAEAES